MLINMIIRYPPPPFLDTNSACNQNRHFFKIIHVAIANIQNINSKLKKKIRWKFTAVEYLSASS